MNIDRISEVMAAATEGPCLRPDFEGDTCDFWVARYGQKPCSNCLTRTLVNAWPRIEAVLRAAGNHEHQPTLTQMYSGCPLCEALAALGEER